MNIRSVGNRNGKAMVLLFGIVAAPTLFAEPLDIGNETRTIDAGEVAYDSLSLGCSARGDCSRLNVFGSASVTVGPTTVGTAGKALSHLTVGGSAVASFGDIAYHNGWTIDGCSFYLTVTNGALVSFGNLSGNNANGSHGMYLTCAGDSKTVQKSGGAFTPHGGGTLHSEVLVREDATLELNSFKLVSANDKIRVTDRATLAVAAESSLSGTAEDGLDVSGQGRLEVRGTYLKVGDSGFGALVLRENAHGVVTPTGMLSLGWNNSEAKLTIRDSAVLSSSSKINVSRGYASDTASAKIFLTGGTLEFPGFQYGHYAPYAGRHCLALLQADGGTIRPTVANDALIEGWPSAELVGAGLTLDTDGHATGISQAFSGTTFTKAGAGVLTAAVDSSHAKTVVAGGTLAFGAAVTAFGGEIVVTNGAVISTAGMTTGLCCDKLTLGDDVSAGVLLTDGAAPVTVPNDEALVVNRGRVILSDPQALGDVVFIKVASGSVSAEKLAKLEIENPTLSRDYAFDVVTDASGSRIVVRVNEVTTHDLTWTGVVDSDWATADNWSPSQVPTVAAQAVFPRGVARRDVRISGAGIVQGLDVADDYTFGGAGSLTTRALQVREGASVTFDVPVAAPSGLDVKSEDGTAIAFNGALSGASSSVFGLAGSCQLTLAAANAGFLGEWDFSALTGRVTLASAEAAGGATGNERLTLGPATLRAEGADAQIVRQAVTLAPGSDRSVSVVDADASLTLASGYTSASGAFVKKGAATLMVSYPQGTYDLARATPDVSLVERGPTAPIALAESGSGVLGEASGLAGFNVLEGTVVLESESSAQVNLRGNGVYAAIGGNYANEAEAVLWLKNVSLVSESMDRYWVVGNFTPEGAAAHPTLRVTDGASFVPGELVLGAAAPADTQKAPVYPTLAVTNASAVARWKMDVGPNRWYPNAAIQPVVRVGRDGVVGSSDTVQLSTGFDVLVDGGTFRGGNTVTLGVAGTAGDKNYSGVARFVNGGRLEVKNLSAAFELADKTLETRFVFDGGKLVISETGSSSSLDPTNVVFVAERNGLEVEVAADREHAFKLPLVGMGPVTKTGAGTFAFEVPGGVASTVGGYAGALTVREGVVDFGNQDISSFASVGGAGTLRRATGGTLTLKVERDATLTLENVTAERVVIDFAALTGQLRKGETFEVARLSGSSVGHVKAVNVGAGLSVKPVVSDGIVTATVESNVGMVLILR